MDLLWQFNHKKNVRYDIVDNMVDCEARRITFTYGNKKWVADRNRGVVYEVINDREYSIKNLHLKAGDVILASEVSRLGRSAL